VVPQLLRQTADSDSGTVKIHVHAGLPRTATTALQRDIFPRLTTIHFVGKHHENRGFKGKVWPIKDTRAACEQHLQGNSAGLEALRRLLPNLLHVVKLRNREGADIRQQVNLWASCLHLSAELLGERPILYSDESLSESMSGITADLAYGDAVVLEQLHHIGFLKHTVLSVVLRDPGQFLKASYYKAMEFEWRYKHAPFSFDEYIRRQLCIRDRHPTASRIFLGCHRKAAAHFRRLCPNTVVTTYEQLRASPNVVDTLLGCATGEAPASLALLPRENASWRGAETNAFILSAQGVPPGITIEQYAQTFPETLCKYSLDQLFASEALEPRCVTSPEFPS
jgi:hypothetical protein